MRLACVFCGQHYSPTRICIKCHGCVTCHLKEKQLGHCIEGVEGPDSGSDSEERSKARTDASAAGRGRQDDWLDWIG